MLGLLNMELTVEQRRVEKTASDSLRKLLAADNWLFAYLWQNSKSSNHYKCFKLHSMWFSLLLTAQMMMWTSFRQIEGSIPKKRSETQQLRLECRDQIRYRQMVEIDTHVGRRPLLSTIEIKRLRLSSSFEVPTSAFANLVCPLNESPLLRILLLHQNHKIRLTLKTCAIKKVQIYYAIFFYHAGITSNQRLC